MDSRNFIALVLSYAYVLGLLAVAETLRKKLGASGDFTRKIVQIGVGMWSIATVMLFTSWKWGLVPPVTFVFLNYLSYRFELVKAIETAERANLGTVFFPISVALLLGWLWRPGTPGDKGFVAVAGLMAMTWGDAMASIVGRRYGTRKYRFFGHTRSMEGTLAMFIASSVSIALVLHFMGGVDFHPAVAIAMIGGTAAAAIEAVSPYGSDNLFVPIVTALVVYVLVESLSPVH